MWYSSCHRLACCWATQPGLAGHSWKTTKKTSSEVWHKGPGGKLRNIDISGLHLGSSVAPPALFIPKYGCILDTAHMKALDIKEDTKHSKTKQTSEEMANMHTFALIEFIHQSVKETKSLISLMKRIQSKYTSEVSQANANILESPVDTGGILPSDVGLASVAKETENIEEKQQPKMQLTQSEITDEFMHWNRARLNWSMLPKYYAMLSKSRLTLLVCTTAAAGYGIAPGAFDPLTLALVTIGTGLTSASANAINQFLEVPYDSQMDRTKNRVLVRGCLSGRHAMGFAAVTGISGVALLGCGINSLTASLGLFNLLLYTCAYTPLKRISIVNTWVGSIVGAIPPIMGYTAATGTIDSGAFVLAAILYAWQFPHFNSLSWNLRPDYSKAGYRMMSVTNPDLCRRVALRYSLGMVLICTASPFLGTIGHAFAFDSLPVNGYLVYLAWKFHQNADSESSRKLFRYTLLHLPILIMLMFVSKKRAAD